MKRLYNFEAYKHALLHNKSDKASFFAFRSSNHIAKHCEVMRVGLTADNDKVFVLGPEASRPLGHYRNKELVEEDPNPIWDLGGDFINNDQYLILADARLIFDAGLAGQPEDDVPILVDEAIDEGADGEWGNEMEADAFNDEDLFDDFEADAFADEDLFD